jgi:hypothetical protein
MFDSEIQVDIQALAHAVELTRRGAIDSLRFAKGDLFLAFQVTYNLHNSSVVKLNFGELYLQHANSTKMLMLVRWLQKN